MIALFKGKAKVTLVAILVFGCTTSLFAQRLRSHTLYFGSDNTYPSYAQWIGLDDFVAQQPKYRAIYRIDGNVEYSNSGELAQERTQVVVRHLMEIGVDPVDIRFTSNKEQSNTSEDSKVAAIDAGSTVEVVAELKRLGNTETEYRLADLASAGCLVNPPLPESRLAVERFHFDAESQQEIRVASGTILLVPSSAFVDADGQVVDGKVELAYEEFHDRAEVFLSGIPMKYDSLGKELPMETYGMFRVSVSNHNGKLDLAPGKAIDLEFISNSANTNVNFYHLDPRHGSWRQLGKAKLMSANSNSESLGNLSPAQRHYLHLISGTSEVKRDNKNLEERFHSQEYMCEARTADKLRNLRNGELREKRVFKKLMKTLPEFRLKIQSAKSSEDRNWVKFTIHDSHLNGNRHRAWKTAFKSHIWQYDGPMSRNEFVQKFHHRTFNDLRVSLDETTDQVILELKDLDGITSIPLMKVTKGELDMDMFRQVYDEMLDAGTKRMLAKRESQFEKRFRVYNNQLKLRERRLSKEADRDHALAQNKWKRDLEWAWEESKAIMSPSESEMAFDDWDAQCSYQAKKHKREAEIRHASKATVVRSLSIATCGIYNCDRLKNLVSPVNVPANFVANGEVLNWYQAFVFDENLNSFLKYSASSTNSINLDPEALLGLIVIDSEGHHFYLQKEDVMAMNHGGTPLRIMNMQQLSPQSDVEDIRQLLSMGF